MAQYRWVGRYFHISIQIGDQMSVYGISVSHVGSSLIFAIFSVLSAINSGTPIMNTLNDAYPLFRFLGIRPWHDWVIFKVSLQIFNASTCVMMHRVRVGPRIRG